MPSFRLVLFSILGLSLVACSDRGPRYPYRVVQMPPPQAAAAISLQDENGFEGPVTTTAGFSLGALAIFKHLGGVDQYRMGVCSVSHLVQGLVTTNAHCVEDSSDPDDYYVLFYDKNGQRKTRKVAAIKYVGNTEVDDIAVLRLDRSTAEEWDAVNSAILDTGADRANFPDAFAVQALPAKTFEIKAWSFDPRGFGSMNTSERAGMRFSPKVCRASRTKFKVTGTTGALTEDAVLTNVAGMFGEAKKIRFDSDKQFYFDKCTADPIEGKKCIADPIQRKKCIADPIQGNSGSLVSMGDDVRRALGVLHWRIFPAMYKKYDKLKVEGNLDTKNIPYNDASKTQNLFFVGTVFHGIAMQELQP